MSILRFETIHKNFIRYLELFWVKLFKLEAQLSKSFQLLESFYPYAELL